MNITFTGIDERTAPGDISYLLLRNAELALLYGHGDNNRYPSRDVIWSIVASFRGQFALHICGKGALAQFVIGYLDDILPYFQRIQINGDVTDTVLCNSCARHPYHTIITQVRKMNTIRSGISNHALLVDGSGGRGVTPAEWVRPVTPHAVGFAGGLGPDNIAAELPRIAAVAVEPT